jgi:hypothetical protein
MVGSRSLVIAAFLSRTFCGESDVFDGQGMVLKMLKVSDVLGRMKGAVMFNADVMRKFTVSKLFVYARADTSREHLALHLPTGYVVEGFVPQVRLVSPVAEYTVTCKLARGSLVASREFMRKKNLVLPEGYAAFRKFCNDVLKEVTKQIVLRKR